MKVVENGRTPFDIAGDIHFEWGLLCTGDGDARELSEMYVFQCWQGCDAHPGGSKKLLCSDIVKELKCGAASILSSNTTVER